jgi:hypothetical protein
MPAEVVAGKTLYNGLSVVSGFDPKGYLPE